MILRCKCGVWWKAHDSSMSVKRGMCRKCKELNIIKFNLKPSPRSPTKPFDDYNPRSNYTKLQSGFLIARTLRTRTAATG